MVILVSSLEMKGPWHTGLGKHPAIGPAAQMEELQTGVHPHQGACALGFLNHGGAESSLALPMGPAFPISFLFAQRKEGTHVITNQPIVGSCLDWIYC